MDTSTVASATHFKICPFCEASRLVFSGLHEARCPTCDREPDSNFLKTLRQIVALPDASRTARMSSPKKGSIEQKGASPEENQQGR